MNGTLWTVVVLALALALAVPVVNGGVTNAANSTAVAETTQVDYTTNYTLQRTDTFGVENLTVEVNGSTLTEGSDYLFDEPARTIDWQNTAATSSGDQANISYDVLTHSERTQDIRRLLATVGGWAGLLVAIAALGYLVTLIGGGDF